MLQAHETKKEEGVYILIGVSFLTKAMEMTTLNNTDSDGIDGAPRIIIRALWKVPSELYGTFLQSSIKHSIGSLWNVPLELHLTFQSELYGTIIWAEV